MGQKIECAVVGEVQRSRSKKVHALELTARPTALEMARKGQTVAFRYSIGSLAKGEVREVGGGVPALDREPGVRDGAVE